MSSLESISSEENTFEFKNILENEKNKLSIFKSTCVVSSDEDEFQLNQKNLPLGKETEDYYKELLKEKTDIIQEQIDKLNNFSILKHEWDLESFKLRNNINCITIELDLHRSNKISLISKLKDYEDKFNISQSKLCSTQSKLEETNSEVEKLYADRKTNEDELCKLRVQISEYKEENDRLNQDNIGLREKLERTQAELNFQKINVNNMEEDFKRTEQTILNQLNEKCKELDDIRTAYEEKNCQLDDEREKLEVIFSTFIEGNGSSEENDCIVHDRKPICQAEHDTEEDYATCCPRKRIEVLRPESEIHCLESADNPTKLGRIKLFSEKVNEFKRKSEAIFRSEKEIEKQCLLNNGCNTKTDLEGCCESDSNVNCVCYSTKLKQLLFEFEDLRKESHLIYNQ